MYLKSGRSVATAPPIERERCRRIVNPGNSNTPTDARLTQTKWPLEIQLLACGYSAQMHSPRLPQPPGVPDSKTGPG